MVGNSGNSIRLGRIRTAPADLGMNEAQRGRHLYVVGSTGVGKSKLLEHLVRQDIKAWPRTKSGLLLLDPHGSVYRNTINWLAAGGPAALERPVIPIDLTQDEWVIAYNLLKRRTTATAAVVVGAMMSAVLHVFGAASVWQTPLLSRWLQNTLRLLYDRQATLTELVPLLEDAAFRQHLIEATKDPMARRDWQRANRYTADKFEDQIGSTLNRLSAFIRSDLLEASFGQTNVSLDLREAMEKGSIILVNCSQARGKLTDVDCQLFATMMLSDLWTAAKERDKESDPKPFYVYVDEFQNFVTETIAKNLDQARGYGLHLTLAHQYPKQLKNEGKAGEKIYDSVMASASSKVVFRMEHMDDLDALTKWLYMRTLNPDKVQLELYSTKVIAHREETRIIETLSQTRGHGTGRGSSEDVGESTGHTESRRLPEDDNLARIYDNEWKNVAEQAGESTRRGASKMESEQESEGRTIAEVPMLVPVYGKERSSVTIESLDVQWFRRMQEVASQDDRECVARLVGMSAPLALRTFDVSAVKKDAKAVKAYLRQRYKKLKFAMPMPEAKRLMQERQAKFIQDVKDAGANTEPTTARRAVSHRLRDSKR